MFYFSNDLFRRLNELELPNNIGLCLLIITNEKQFVDFESYNFKDNCEYWLYKQGYNFWIKTKSKFKYCYDENLWINILGLDECQKHPQFQRSLQISLNFDDKILNDTRFNQIKALSIMLKHFHEICFKQKKSFAQKTNLIHLAEFVVKLIVVKHLSEKIKRKKLFGNFPFLFPTVLKNIILDYLPRKN